MDFIDSISTEDSLILLILGIVLVVFLGLYLYFLYSLQELIKLIRPENRSIKPGQVWLLLIPLFSVVWLFVVVSNLSDSVANEYRSRGLTPLEIKPGYNIGMWMAGLGAVSLICGSITSLASLVLWIIYWTRMNRYKQELEQGLQFDGIIDLPG